MENPCEKGLCGADCGACPDRAECRGCLASGGCPHGEDCFVASYLRVGGEAAYRAFQRTLLDEVNEALTSLGLPPAQGLVELRGKYVNLPYPLPGGKVATFLSDNAVYLGAQVALPEAGVSAGVVCNASFLLIAEYSVDGTSPELLYYKKR